MTGKVAEQAVGRLLYFSYPLRFAHITITSHAERILAAQLQLAPVPHPSILARGHGVEIVICLGSQHDAYTIEAKDTYLV